MICDCKDWQESEPQIESAQILSSLHGGEYTGAYFKFCPWCGKILKEEDTDDRS